MHSPRDTALVLEGMPTAIPLDIFDPSYPYSYCRICGEMFQTKALRKPVTRLEQYDPVNAPRDSIAKCNIRRAWALKHDTKHTQREHEYYSRGGTRYFSPEAAAALSRYGIFPVSELVLVPEVLQAVNENHLKLPANAPNSH